MKLIYGAMMFVIPVAAISWFIFEEGPPPMWVTGLFMLLSWIHVVEHFLNSSRRR